MIIQYKPVGGSAYTTLVDESAGGVVADWKPKGQVNIQREPLATATGAANSEFRQPLGNVRQTIPLVLQVFYPDRGTALAAIATLTLALLTSKNHLLVNEPTGTAATLYYPNAVCTSFDADLTGSSVQYKITFESDLVTTTAT
jgi:hypothetical protein